jgi:hypothetical protein
MTVVRAEPAAAATSPIVTDVAVTRRCSERIRVVARAHAGVRASRAEIIVAAARARIA